MVGVICRAALSLIGIFAFLETLLFRPIVFTPYSSGDVLIVSPLASAIAVIVVMAIWELIMSLLNKQAPHFARSLTTWSSFILPAISILSLIIVLVAFEPVGRYFTQIVPLIVILCLGIATISQIHCFTRDSLLDSQSLLLASGLGIMAATLIFHLAFSIFTVNAFGALIVATLMTVTGAILAWDFGKRPSSGKAHIKPPKAPIGVPITRETTSGFKEIAPIAIPIILESLFCTASLGLRWEADPFTQIDSSRGLFILALAVGTGYTILVYRDWKRRMDIDVLLAWTTVPLALTILISILGSSTAPVLLFTITMLSELLFLLLAWVSALMIGRISSTIETFAPAFIVAFLVIYACFMLLSKLLVALAIVEVLALAALCMLFYLVFFFVRKSRLQPEAEDTQSEEFSMMLRKRCALIAAQHHLSPRETELLPLFAMGLTAGAVGRRAFISPETVKTHRSRIYEKIGVRKHDELVELLDLLEPDVLR